MLLDEVHLLGEVFEHELVTAVRKLRLLRSPEPDDVGEELNLLWRPVAVGSVDLPVDVARIDEEDLVLAISAPLAPIEEPESDWQGHRVKEVGPYRDDYVDASVFDELSPDLHFGPASVRG